jgi:hypothetical protein
MMSHARSSRLDALTVATIAFVAANVLHGIDHERQGTARLTPEVFYGGALLTIAAFVTLWLVLRRSPRAPRVAAVVGLSAGFGVTAAHALPHWSAFSDSYPELGADALSWAVMLIEVVAGFVLGTAGIRELRRPSARRPSVS